jgi:GPH family glycoside/pentoside/hexuronide:cation symporter
MWIMRDYDLTEEKAVEISAKLAKRKEKPTSFYQTNKLDSLLASGTQIDSSSDTDFSSKTDADIKALFSESLNNGLHGLCFSPYLEGQNIGDQLSKSQISQRMDVIAPYTQWVRSFSCTEGNEHTPKIAHEKHLKTMVGAWIGSDKAQNEKELNTLIKLGKSGFVDIAVVGNETLMREELTEQELIAYINRVKRALPGIPVGYVDAYYQFVERPKLIEACDVILANCYPFWEGCSIDQSATYLKQMYAVVQQVANGKPVIITETGWPNQGDSTKDAKPSENNAMKYFIDTANWAHQNEVPLFYFSSFDESWKVHHEGDVGARWGLWDTNENLKFQ